MTDNARDKEQAKRLRPVEPGEVRFLDSEGKVLTPEVLAKRRAERERKERKQNGK